MPKNIRMKSRFRKKITESFFREAEMLPFFIEVDAVEENKHM